MSVTSRARRSDALFYSSEAGIDRRWLCNKVALLEEEKATLQEFAKDTCELAQSFYRGLGTQEDLEMLEADFAELGIKE